jgi:hypothetical protein
LVIVFHGDDRQIFVRGTAMSSWGCHRGLRQGTSLIKQ